MVREGKYDHKIRLEYVNIFQRVVVDNVESVFKSVSKLLWNNLQWQVQRNIKCIQEYVESIDQQFFYQSWLEVKFSVDTS